VTQGSVASVDALLDLARTLRERDVETRRLVASATANLGADNDRIRSLLDAAGLTDAVIKGSLTPETSVGGDMSAPQPQVALLDGRFAENSSENQALRGILELLPATMPLASPGQLGVRISSPSGARRHPVPLGHRSDSAGRRRHQATAARPRDSVEVVQRLREYDHPAARARSRDPVWAPRPHARQGR
jgi:hypothetical protein